MITLRVAALALSIALSSILGCKRGERTPASGLVGTLTGAKDLATAVGATQEALAKGGITVVNGDQTAVNAIGPSSSISFSPGETYALALEARNRPTVGRMTLAELGDMLQDFGWPFKSGPLPGEQLVEFLKVWVSEARKNPQDPQSFTPLFLSDMAKTQVPAVDLEAGEYSSEELRFSLLELHLLAAAFDRALKPKVSKARLPAWLLPSVAHAQGDPCSQLKERMSKAYGDLTKAGVEVVSVALSEALETLIEAGGEYGQRFADALSALSVAAKLWKLANLYAYNEVVVTVESKNPTHKPLKGEGNKDAAFTLRAGINDQDWEEFQKTFNASDFIRIQRDCLGALGVPEIPDQGDVGKDSKNWRVEWRLLPETGLEEHAYISRDKNPEFEKAAGGALGQLQMNLEKSSDHSATATLIVDILPEKHEHKGTEKKVEVTAKATLETSAPPTLSAFVNAFKGGAGAAAVATGLGAGVGWIISITDALVEVCAGWFQEIAQPEAYATLTVTYHEPGVKLHIVDANKVELDFRGKKRLWLFGALSSETSRHVYDGYIQLGKDSLWHGQVVATAKGAYIAGDTAAITRRAAESGHVDENSSFEEVLKAFGNMVELIGDIPTCKGAYYGVQTFAVEGSFTSNEAGVPQVELALMPVGPPESYRDTPGCPWGMEEIDGIKTLPVRIPKGQETVLLIDVPKPGEKRIYRKWVDIPDIHGSTVVTVGP